MDQNGQAVTFNGSGIAIAGEFDGNTADGDEVGLYDGSHFWLDTNHDFKIDAGDTVITTQLRGFPIVGDFNGDGTVDLATWQTDTFQFNFGVTGTGGNSGTAAQFSGNKDATINWGFPGVGEIPLAADMDGDGITDIGLWVPGHAGTVPQDSAEEFFLLSNDFNPTTGLPNNTGLTDPNAAFQLLNHPFATFPLGHDLYANLLDEFATPIVGNFDPPLSPAPSSVDSTTIANDVTPPTSTVSALPATETSTSFTVSWNGSDNSGGSGISSYDIYVSDNGGRFTQWLNNTTNTSASFNGVNGHTYSFLSVATDNAANVQDTPTAGQATTKVQLQVQATSSTTLGTSSASITTGQSVMFTATVTGNMGMPTGSVTFKDGSTTLTTVTLVNGVAAYTTSAFAAGGHSITAIYNPLAPNVGSTSVALLETVSNPSAPPQAPFTFNGTAGNDIITVMPSNATGSFTVLISNSTTKNKATSLGTFTGAGTITINGLAGNDTLQISTATIGGKVVSITNPVSFSGGDGTNTLIASNIANVWAITGANSGTLNGNAFSGIENLTGGTSTDAFRFQRRRQRRWQSHRRRRRQLPRLLRLRRTGYRQPANQHGDRNWRLRHRPNHRRLLRQLFDWSQRGRSLEHYRRWRRKRWRHQLHRHGKSHRWRRGRHVHTGQWRRRDRQNRWRCRRRHAEVRLHFTSHRQPRNTNRYRHRRHRQFRRPGRRH